MTNTVFVLVDEDTMELADPEWWGTQEEAEEAREDSDNPDGVFVMEMDESDYLDAVRPRQFIRGPY